MTKLAVRFAAVGAWVAGLALLVWLFTQVDFAAVLAAIRGIGFWGIALIVGFHSVPLWLDAVGWHLLFPQPRPSHWGLVWARWICEAGNALLPGQAGEFIRIRAAMLAGASGTAATSTSIVDLTIGVVTQIVFSLIGLGIFALHTGGGRIVLWLTVGILALLVAIGIFIAVQHRGMFGALAPLVSRWIARAPSIAGAVDKSIRAIWQRPGALAVAASARLLSFILGAGEVWLAFWLLGAGVSIADAIALESLVLAARAAAFLIPSGLGVQEGALLLLCGALGIPAESALALGLVKRVRELSLGIPGILTWQAVEVRARRVAPPVS